jgi:hypothetical protein
MFWVPRSGSIGLGISILSYDGKVTVGIASDEGRMPDPEVLLEGFEEEFNHLLDLVNSGKIEEEPLVLHDRFQEAREKRGTDTPRKDEDREGLCTAMTRNKRPCRNRAVAGSRYCRVHGGEKERGDTRLEDVTRLMKELTRS